MSGDRSGTARYDQRPATSSWNRAGGPRRKIRLRGDGDRPVKENGDPSNEFETVTAQGEFVNVHLHVSNVGEQAQSFFASNQKLQIGDKQFSADNLWVMWTKSMDVEINPGNSIQAVASFDVPPGSSNDGVLTVHDSVFSFGAKISLQQPGQ